MPTTVSAAEARANFSKIGAIVNSTGEPVTVFKNSQPWLVISPAKEPTPNEETLQAMRDAEKIISDPNRQRFVSLLEMMDELKREADACS